jgi:surfeit locus 1 family protein
MLGRFRQARLIWPAIVALAALAILVALGSWQLERKRWKEGLLAKIAERVQAPPVSLQDAVRRAKAGEDIEYLHVAAEGRFLHDMERYLYAPAPGGLAWHVYTPLETAPAQIVWVNRGAVPDGRKLPETRREGQIGGQHVVVGLARGQIGKALFAPENDARQNVWYWPDIPALTRSAFGPQAAATVPLWIDVDAQPEPPGGLPRGGVTRIALPNRHLEYAITWYGLALALVAVFLAFCAKRLRGADPPF